MKLSQALLVAVLVSLAAITVRADGVPSDARIIVGTGPDPKPCVTDLPEFTIKLGSGDNGGVIDCQNTSGLDWIGLTITGTTMAGQTIHIEDMTPPSSTLSFNTVINETITTIGEPDHKQLVTFTLMGGPGIPANSSFFFDLNDDGSLLDHTGHWEGQLTVTPILAPEPGTVILLLSGLGGLWFRRRRQSSLETNH
jgi:hypothetical protein